MIGACLGSSIGGVLGLFAEHRHPMAHGLARNQMAQTRQPLTEKDHPACRGAQALPDRTSCWQPWPIGRHLAQHCQPL